MWYFRSSIAAPVKSRTFTTRLFLVSLFSLVPVSIESTTMKQVPASHACLKLQGVWSLLTSLFFFLLLYSEHVCFKYPRLSLLTNSSWLLTLVILILLMLLFSSFYSLLEWDLINSLSKSIPFPFSSELPVWLIWPRVSNKLDEVTALSITAFLLG